MPEIWGNMYNVVLGQGYKNWDDKLVSCTAKKDAKQLVSIGYAKILEKESSD
jgi:hypothetical protein